MKRQQQLNDFNMMRWDRVQDAIKEVHRHVDDGFTQEEAEDFVLKYYSYFNQDERDAVVLGSQPE
jgi:hypothetical protein